MVVKEASSSQPVKITLKKAGKEVKPDPVKSHPNQTTRDLPPAGTYIPGQPLKSTIRASENKSPIIQKVSSEENHYKSGVESVDFDAKTEGSSSLIMQKVNSPVTSDINLSAETKSYSGINQEVGYGVLSTNPKTELNATSNKGSIKQSSYQETTMRATSNEGNIQQEDSSPGGGMLVATTNGGSVKQQSSSFGSTDMHLNIKGNPVSKNTEDKQIGGYGDDTLITNVSGNNNNIVQDGHDGNDWLVYNVSGSNNTNTMEFGEGNNTGNINFDKNSKNNQVYYQTDNNSDNAVNIKLSGQGNIVSGSEISNKSKNTTLNISSDTPLKPFTTKDGKTGYIDKNNNSVIVDTNTVKKVYVNGNLDPSSIDAKQTQKEIDALQKQDRKLTESMAQLDKKRQTLENTNKFIDKTIAASFKNVN